MPGLERTGNANPLDMGADPNSVDASAEDFTRMLVTEIPPKGSRRISDTGKPPPRKAAPEPAGDDGANADPSDDEPRPKKPEEDDLSDEFLDNETRTDPDDRDPAKDGDDEDEDAEDDDAEGDDDADDDKDTEDAEIDPDTEFEVMVNGKAQNVPLKELLTGYSREADYRQKTARLSEERQEVEEFAEQVVEQRSHYETKLNEFQDLVKTFQPSPEDWEALKRSDPNLYIQTKEQWDALNRKLADAEGERQRVSNEALAQQLRTYNSYVRKQDELLFGKIPALKNPAKAKQFRSRLMKYAEANGYSAEEVQKGLVDHRDILTMYKASLYDEIRANRQKNARPGKGKKAVRRVSATTPSESPRRISRQQGDGGRVRDAERRLARTGSLEDAGNAFAAMISSNRI